MKTITLLCAILWAITTLFYLYGMTLGDYPMDNFSLDSVETVFWFLANAATTVFFFVLWTNQK